MSSGACVWVLCGGLMCGTCVCGICVCGTCVEQVLFLVEVAIDENRKIPSFQSLQIVSK